LAAPSNLFEFARSRRGRAIERGVKGFGHERAVPLSSWVLVGDQKLCAGLNAINFASSNGVGGRCCS
jgi:hypothetical protein